MGRDARCAERNSELQKHEREKKELRANVEKIPRDEMEGLLEEMSNKHNEEVKALLEKADDHLEGMKKIKETSGDKRKVAARIWTNCHS